MSSPLRPLGGPYIFHLVWHLFDFVSAGDAVSCPREKTAWKINHAHFLKVSYPISQTCKLEATSCILYLTCRLWLSLPLWWSGWLVFFKFVSVFVLLFRSVLLVYLTLCSDEGLDGSHCVWRRQGKTYEIQLFIVRCKFTLLLLSLETNTDRTLWFSDLWIYISYCVSVLHDLMHVVLHREHDQVHWKPWQPALPYSHDHAWPGERGQGLAPGEEPRARRPEGRRPRQQDGLRDLPDTASGYQGEPSVFCENLTLDVCSFIGTGSWCRDVSLTLNSNFNL